MTLLAVRHLQVRYGAVQAVRGVSLELAAGSTLGLVGESGCGKSTLALAILNLLPPGGAVTAGQVLFDGQDLLSLPPAALRRRRWVDIAYVPQGAMNAFDPVRNLLRQFDVTWRAHRSGATRARAEDLCRRVELDPKWLRNFPHEYSGGMRQRAAIAMALLFEPRLLIADEPTTGLDVIVQRQALDLLRDTQRERGMAMLFVSHDMAVVAELCDRVAVMYAGEVVEVGLTENVLGQPSHPYTMGLRQAFPDIRAPDRRLVGIPGGPPSLAPPPMGCSFAPRCPFVLDLCRAIPPVVAALPDGSMVACHRAGEARDLAAIAALPESWRAVA